MNQTNKLFQVCIPQPVKIRKYEVDIKKLQLILREKKSKKRLNNEQVANMLKVPKTMVDHWFRTDSYFSIPDDKIWISLKELLEIDTDEFDQSIMEFEYRDGVFEKSERCYYDFGICPTLTCNDEIKIIQII